MLKTFLNSKKFKKEHIDFKTFLNLLSRDQPSLGTSAWRSLLGLESAHSLDRAFWTKLQMDPETP